MKKGFTLAEILIVLFILGIVSILTVPSLLEMYRFRIYTANFNRVTSQLTTALSNAITDQNGDNITEEVLADGIYATKYGNFNLLNADSPTQDDPNKGNIYKDFLENYMNATEIIGPEYSVKEDGTEDTTLNWPYPDIEYINLNGQSWRNWAKFKLGTDAFKLFSNDMGACGKTPQGAVLCIGYTTGIGNKTELKKTYIHLTPRVNVSLDDGTYKKETVNEIRRGAIFVYLDTNGPKPPNATGYDFFILQVNNDGTLSDVYVSSSNWVNGVGIPAENISLPKASECAQVGATTPGGNGERSLKAFGCYTRVMENGGKITKFENES